MDKEERTALIVDDEEIMLDIESFFLQKVGFNTLKATNSEEACRLYHRLSRRCGTLIPR